ncbi:MAG: metallophosphoesterase [Actinomycetes bacterium]
MSHIRSFTAAMVASAGIGLAYSLWEARQYTLRRFDVPVLAAGERPLRVLHLSDLHLTPDQVAKREWVRRLAALEPDLVIDTGDNLAHTDAVPWVLDALEPLLDTPGAFVMGSNDYYGPVLKNPVRYFNPALPRVYGRPLPWTDLRDGLTASGWLDLDNARTTLKVGHRTIELVGVDDPHLRRDRYDEVGGTVDPTADLSIGVTHAPYRRVVKAMANDGVPLVLAGHTHGGQLCVPGWGALVTNCDLPVRQAKGLSRVAGSSDQSWLHVSAGLGCSPYTPVRFACRPEATLLTLVPRD